ncbi:iron-containing redox enzyme family protein [Streptomyces sp. NPDC012769]|uniref:iron-containing redox enzyme family protein n=1 Tax=Streptomyces sp. NPDC012769 TaxID=3364848 RepID=UPI0036855454
MTTTAPRGTADGRAAEERTEERTRAEVREHRRPADRPALPPPRGDLSEAVTDFLLGRSRSLPGPRAAADADPYGEDLHLALHLAYELHYRGFDGVPDDMEWDPDLLRLRALLERRFEDALRERRGRSGGVREVFDALLTEPVDGSGASHYLLRHGTLDQLREYAVLRSVYQLREADPHLWVVPRLRGRAKAAMMTVQYDEYGCGRAEQMHARLFADLMEDLGLDSGYGRYLPFVGAPALAAVNLMSLFGLHRSRRGALVGHFAALEVTSSPAASRIAAAMRRMGAGEAAIRFYDEHVEADAVHEQLVRRDVVGGLLADEPDLADDVTFGVEATVLLEDALSDSATRAWEAGTTALRAPLGVGDGTGDGTGDGPGRAHVPTTPPTGGDGDASRRSG